MEVKIISVLLVSVMLFSIAPLAINAASNNEIAPYGKTQAPFLVKSGFLMTAMDRPRLM